MSGAPTTLRYPRSRYATFDVGRIARDKHTVAGLLEVDVTALLVALGRAKASGERVSFTGAFLKCVAHVAARHSEVHAVAARPGRLVAFSDVDVATVVERDAGGAKVPLAMVVRRANHKSAAAITAELDGARARSVSGERATVSGGRLATVAMSAFHRLPQPLRVGALRVFLRSPAWRKATMGTIMVTSVGMIAKLPGWFVPTTVHNLSFAVGSTTKKPWVVDGRVEIRDVLHLTVVFDHDVIDGAPMARFIGELVSQLESGALPL